MNNIDIGSEKPSTGMLNLSPSLPPSLLFCPIFSPSAPVPNSAPRPVKLILPYPAVLPLSVRQDATAAKVIAPGAATCRNKRRSP